jgi:arsenate reductase
MAEGFMKNMYPQFYEVFSAGVQATGVNPYAKEIMNEIGIDISGQCSKSIDEYRNVNFDYVVTLSDKARQASQGVFNNAMYLHKDFYDPGTKIGSREDVIVSFRAVREEIREWIVNNFNNGN